MEDAWTGLRRLLTLFRSLLCCLGALSCSFGDIGRWLQNRLASALGSQARWIIGRLILGMFFMTPEGVSKVWTACFMTEAANAAAVAPHSKWSQTAAARTAAHLPDFLPASPLMYMQSLVPPLETSP